MRIIKSTRIRRNPDIIFNKIEDEVVMLSFEKGEYYGLDKTGSVIWTLLEKEMTFQELIESILLFFEITEEQCEKDTLEFLYDLHSRKLLLIEGD